MIQTLLIGDSKTGKTKALETLPGGIVLWNFDPLGWTSLDRVGALAKKRVILITSIKDWAETPNNRLAPNEILVMNFFLPTIISTGIGTSGDATALTRFITEANYVWQNADKLLGMGVCHQSLDSFTGLQKPILNFMKAMQGHVILTQQDWGFAISKVEEIIDSFLGMPFDLICISHLELLKNEMSGEIISQPNMFGKALPFTLITKFSDIFLTVREPMGQGAYAYKWSTVPRDFFKNAGSRTFDGLQGTIEPNFLKLYNGKLVGGGGSGVGGVSTTTGGK